MYFSDKVRVETAAGPAFVDPHQVVMVMMAGDGAELVLADRQQRIPATEPADEVAKKLWRCTNKADNAYFNERHVHAIVSKSGGGSIVMMTGGTVLDQSMGADELEALHRSANDLRRSATGTQ